MGAFYGSTQVRTTDREKVIQAAQTVAKLNGIHCLVGPALNGWVGVYPEHSGQDDKVGSQIAQAIGGEVIHLLLHDDDVLAYWFWVDGRLEDSYWSMPGYFGEKDRHAQEQMAGRPETLAKINGAVIAELREVLRRDDESAFESERLERFANLLGIHNAATSYEYLKAGEREGIQGWREFQEVPQDLIDREKDEGRERRKQVNARKKQLRKTGVLLYERIAKREMPRVCTIAEGFLVGWTAVPNGTEKVERYRSPWTEPEIVELDISGQINAVSADSAGQRVAMALGKSVAVWEVNSWKLLLTVPQQDWAINVALSRDGRLVTYTTREELVVVEVDSGKRLLSHASAESRHMAFSPSADWLVLGGASLELIPIGHEAKSRTLFPGGIAVASAWEVESRKRLHEEMNKADPAKLAKLEAQMRSSLESMLKASQKKTAAKGNSRAAEEWARFNAEIEKQIASLKTELRQGSEVEPSAPARANETSMCLGFTPDARWFWNGTNVGLRVFDWRALLTAQERAQPRPVFSYDGPRDQVGNASGYFYAAASEPNCGAIIFAGLEGVLRRMDLSSGEVRNLVTMPEGGAITGLFLANEGKVLATVSQCGIGNEKKRNDDRSVLSIWDYEKLRKEDAST